MKLTSNATVYIVILAVMLLVILWSLFGMKEFESKLLPLFFGGFIFVMAAIGLGSEILAIGKKQEAVSAPKKYASVQTGENWRGYFINGAWVGGFILSIYLLGFIIAIPIFILFYMRWLGTRWLASIIWAILVPIAIYVAFEVVLDIDLYRGLLLQSLL